MEYLRLEDRMKGSQTDSILFRIMILKECLFSSFKNCQPD